MNTKLLKEIDSPNKTLDGLVARLTTLKNDREYQREIGVGSFSYSEGINDALEAIEEYKYLTKGVENA